MRRRLHFVVDQAVADILAGIAATRHTTLTGALVQLVLEEEERKAIRTAGAQKAKSGGTHAVER